MHHGAVCRPLPSLGPASRAYQVPLSQFVASVNSRAWNVLNTFIGFEVWNLWDFRLIESQTHGKENPCPTHLQKVTAPPRTQPASSTIIAGIKCQIRTSRSLDRAQQATLLVTLAEVAIIWSPLVPLLRSQSTGPAERIRKPSGDESSRGRAAPAKSRTVPKPSNTIGCGCTSDVDLGRSAYSHEAVLGSFEVSMSGRMYGCPADDRKSVPEGTCRHSLMITRV